MIRMPATVLALVLAAFTTGGMLSALQSSTDVRQIGTIERLHPGLDELVPPGAEIEIVAEGFDWSEGPVWHPAKGLLLFSDVPVNTVFQWEPSAGVGVFLKPSGHTGPARRHQPGSNGLAFDRKGQLFLCQHGDRRIARLNLDGSFDTVVSHYRGHRLNSPNDLVFHSNGDLYFTDPPYGLEGRNASPDKELDFNGVFRFSASGELILLNRELSFPNGIHFSPDEKTLYVANSDPEKAIWMAFDVLDDGNLGQGRVFYDMTSRAGQLKGLPDGLKVDHRGNVFATGPGGVNVFSPEGVLLGRINPGVATANCAWGDDGSVLYMTADMYLCRLQLSTQGSGF